ncbi:MAG TPA: hypothetical protein VGM86_17470 [Thermoanaerobaculia bacterium]|jgi:hypothetical protein
MSYDDLKGQQAAVTDEADPGVPERLISYDDFKGRPWKIIDSTTDCPQDARISIDGPETNVTVTCMEPKPKIALIFGSGHFKAGKILAQNGEYTISLITRKPKRIIVAQFNSTTGGTGGSWTAEDTSGSGSDGD